MRDIGNGIMIPDMMNGLHSDGGWIDDACLWQVTDANDIMYEYYVLH